MLKLEIKLDDHKIAADQKYQMESIYQALEQTFTRSPADGSLFLSKLCQLTYSC